MDTASLWPQRFVWVTNSHVVLQELRITKGQIHRVYEVLALACIDKTKEELYKAYRLMVGACLLSSSPPPPPLL